jgi:hypothetical protein
MEALVFNIFLIPNFDKDDLTPFNSSSVGAVAQRLSEKRSGRSGKRETKKKKKKKKKKGGNRPCKHFEILGERLRVAREGLVECGDDLLADFLAVLGGNLRCHLGDHKVGHGLEPLAAHKVPPLFVVVTSGHGSKKKKKKNRGNF